MNTPLDDDWKVWNVMCGGCGNAIDERYETVWRKVEGWEHKRWQGGTNHIACRKKLNEYRCDGCMRKMTRGLNEQQQQLI